MKWSGLQIVAVTFLLILLWLLELLSGRTIEPVIGQWKAVYSPIVTFLVVGLVITCFYLIFLFEARKKRNILQSKIWAIMPKLIVVISILSVILFLVGGTIGPMMDWVEQWRSLIYVFMIYFLLLIYIFIFSIEYKKEKSIKSIHIAYLWTLVLFFVLFVIF